MDILLIEEKWIVKLPLILTVPPPRTFSYFVHSQCTSAGWNLFYEIQTWSSSSHIISLQSYHKPSFYMRVKKQLVISMTIISKSI